MKFFRVLVLGSVVFSVGAFADALIFRSEAGLLERPVPVPGYTVEVIADSARVMNERGVELCRLEAARVARLLRIDPSCPSDCVWRSFTVTRKRWFGTTELTKWRGIALLELPQ